MRRFVIGALDNIVLRKLLAAFKAERVSTRQRKRLLVIVIVRLEADATFKDGIHYLSLQLQVLKFQIIQ